MMIEISVAEAKNSLSKLFKRARQSPAIVTRRGEPDVVLLPFEEYERLRRLHACFRMVSIPRKLESLGLAASEFHQSLRQELEERP